MFRILLIFIFLLSNSLFSSSNLLDEKEIQWLDEHKIITMCNNPNWEPIEFLKNNTPNGIAIDILKKLEKMYGIKFTHIKTKSWSESQQFLKEKRCDILPTAIPTQQRAKYAIFTESYLSYKLAIIAQSNKPFVENISLLLNKKLARRKGSGLISKLKQQYPNITIIETSGYQESLQKVSNGDVYYTVATLPVASHFISKLGLYNLSIIGYLDSTYNLSIAMHKDNSILKNILNKMLKNIPRKEISTIEHQWSTVKIKESSNIDYTLLSKILFFIILIIIFFVYRQKQLSKYQIKLQKNNKQFKQMINATMEGIIISEKNIVIDANTAAIKLFNTKNKDQLIGLNIFNQIAEKDKPLVEKRLLVNLTEPTEVTLLQLDGSQFPAIIQGKTIIDEGKTIRITSILDLSEIKQKESLFIQSTKMAQMGEMIGNIAHQWRQPLSVITTAASGIKIKKEYGIIEDAELYSLLDSILFNSEQLSDTIDFFRNFIQEKVELQEVLIQDRIDNALKIVNPRIINNHIKFINNINYTDPIHVTIVLGELSQVIINIINNAIDILEEKNIDEKIVEIDLQTIDNTIVITIEDNAGGIPLDVISHIFEPYFTTKHKSVGTGIGLYMSYDIIKNHMKGNLYAQNTDRGAKFFIEIPIEKRQHCRRKEEKQILHRCRRIEERRKI